MIKVGDICIWQHVRGKLAYLNGTETTVTGPLTLRQGYSVNLGKAVEYLGYWTDTTLPGFHQPMSARVHQLRKKFPDADDEEMLREVEQEHEEVFNEVDCKR